MKKNYSRKNCNTSIDFTLKMRALSEKLILLLLVAFNFNAFGQSDNCATTSVLTVGTSCSTTSYNVTSAFNNDGATPCSGVSYRDGWFSFTTDATTSSVTIAGTSNKNLGLAVYSGSCGALTQVACTVPATANATLSNIGVNPSTTYLLRLMRTNNGASNNMTGTVCVYKAETVVPATGNNSYSMCSGNLYDNGGSAGNYATASNGYTVLNPSTPGNLIRITGSTTVEGGYDYLTIYDGTGTGGTVLWGGAPHGTGPACSTFAIPNITSTTGPLTVRFDSDDSTNCTGFNLTVSCITLPPCSTPTTQPTALNLSVSGTTINGTFTAASPAPSGYLIVRSSSATPPTLTNGTTYSVGFTGLAPGTTRVIQGSFVTSNAVTFSDTGLTANTQYYYHIFSYNSACSGTPFYLTTTPLTNNATTCIAAPTSPVNSSITANSFTVTWGPSAGAVNYVLEVYTNSGYTIPVSGSPFTVASPTVTYNVTGLSGPVTYYYRIRATTGSCNSGYISGTVTTLLGNDECSGAIPLTISTTCSYATYTTAGATASTGMTPPGCANYSGNDVWFSVVVPATGEINIDLQTGVMTDSGIAFYSGTCGALTLLDCDDDSSANGLMSFLRRTGLTPGQTIYIRVWEYGNDNNGTFGICATTPSCPSPSDLLANILSATSVTINWTASSPPASGGYQYYVSNSPTPPTASTPPTGTTAPGVIGVTFTGLTTGLNYYFWVRSYCGGSDTSTWFGPTNYKPCAVGNGTGTTTLPCPSVLAGGIGMSGNNPLPVNCSGSTCTTLEATSLQLNEPTGYTVSAITEAPPYQFACLQNPVSVNIDDVWSSTINLPFNFCFYGNNYNKCLIGSNGVITFDTTTYAPGGYNAWLFTSNLPNPSLFRSAIFGAYHDIDPSKGGQVGYELITLTSGCRALVASWNDIPMYSTACNSQLYTGMIVLYENTNVIDVFIKEKNVCSTWNDGNAIIGIQNGAGNAAVVAPGRNGLDANWTVGGTVEGWRFTPSGPSLTTVQWYQGSINPANLLSGATTSVVGNVATSTINVCPAVSTTYHAQVTYSLCTGALQYSDTAVITVNGNKIWNGSQNTTAWNNAANWTPPGVPVSSDCVIVPQVGNGYYPVVSAAPDAVGYNLNVYNNASLTINSNQNITITDRVTVQSGGIFTLNNSASLIQINNILNSGNIIYKRESPNIRTLDYVYWSSPVANFNISNIVTPYAFGPIYHWNTTLANANGGQGTWQNFSGNMVAGKGYIARSPGTAPFNNSSFNVLSGTFTGVPNNGNITLPIERGNDQNAAYHTGTNGVEVTNLSDNWNLLGNPYPSAIRGSQFLFDNNTKIEGNIRLWTHGTLPSNLITNPFYSSFVYNYTAGDYFTYNFTGTSCCPAAGADLFIGAGQGFFVQMIDGPPVAAAANVTVTFNNNLRNTAYSNTSFYKTSNTTSSVPFNVDAIERNRIWLDLINTNGQSDRTLFGYIENATMGVDSFFDCITQNTGGNLIYSKIGDTKFSIQGRSLPFDVNDEVTIGINIPTQGNYTIALAAIDGLFNNQKIYLRDELLNVIHDIKTNPYHFSSISGAINDRFKVVYIDNALANPTHSNEREIKVMVNNEVTVSSGSMEMESIVVYNLLGQKLDSFDKIRSNYIILSNLHKNNATLLLKIKLQTGETVTKKIIY